jgi:hypothetical protein
MPTANTPIAIFGDADLGIWGLLVDDGQPRLALAGLDAHPGEIDLQAATVDRDDDQIWTVAAGSNSLRLEKGLATTMSPGDERHLEPLRITGTAWFSGAAHEIDIPGVLCEGALDADSDSLRLFGNWFPAGHQVVLRAARPRGAKGQDRDVIDVIALGESEAVVFDPRLSTTYDSSTAPRQAGIELWIGADEEGDQYPRRVNGVATGSSVSGSTDGVRLDAHALRCVSRGETGAGVYVLLRAA